MKKSFKNEIKQLLGEVHFGLSPDSDKYVERIFVKDVNNNTRAFDNSTDLIKNIIKNNISPDDINVENVSVVFSELIYEDISREYIKYAVLSNDK